MMRRGARAASSYQLPGASWSVEKFFGGGAGASGQEAKEAAARVRTCMLLAKLEGRGEEEETARTFESMRRFVSLVQEARVEHQRPLEYMNEGAPLRLRREEEAREMEQEDSREIFDCNPRARVSPVYYTEK